MMNNSPFSITPENRKINPIPTLSATKPDGSADDNDRVEIGPTALAFDEWSAAGLTTPHLPTMREYRLKRLVSELIKRDLAGVLLFDPLNIRYATDSTNMQLWTTHNAARACFVSATGYVVLWDFHGCEHLTAHLPLVKELRTGASFFYFESGNRVDEHARKFAITVDGLMREHSGSNRRLAVDKIELPGARALEKLGIKLHDGQEVCELARAIKGADEINAMRCAIHACEASIDAMRTAFYAGQTENDIWAALHAENIRRGGEWIETRILSSGPRTNPWFQESGPRIVQNGELLAFDTDLIGTYGMCVDISRTWKCGDEPPTKEQKNLYQVAYEHIMTNAELVKPGVDFLTLSRDSHRLPKQYRSQRYGVIFHGVGLCDEYPSIRYPEDIDSYGYDGVLEPGMMLCVEAYVGAVGGKEGVKLEDQLLVTEDGFENLTNYPFELNFL